MYIVHINNRCANSKWLILFMNIFDILFCNIKINKLISIFGIWKHLVSYSFKTTKILNSKQYKLVTIPDEVLTIKFNTVGIENIFVKCYINCTL